jgi:cytochrome c6
MKRLTLTLALILAPAMALADEAPELWKAKCKGCHGEDGKAQTKIGQKEKVADLTTSEWQAKHSDQDIRTVITEGSKDNKKMKPFKDKLSTEEIDALIKYVRGMKAGAK